MNLKLSVYLLSIILISSANATGRLRSNLADPDALVVGDQVYFSGTSGKEELYFFTTSKANFVAVANGGGSQSSSSPAITYNPSKIESNRYPGHNHKYCYIVAPDLHNDGVNITLTFSAIFKPNTNEECKEILAQGYDYAIFYAKFESGNFGPPLLFSSPDNSVVGKNTRGDFNNKTPRIDSERFTENGVTYWSYTWFIGKKEAWNANSTVNMSNNFIYNNTFPNITHDKGITEAPNIFKRIFDGKENYYFVYSENLWYGAYQMYYKKASTIAGLDPSIPDPEKITCRLTFNSWETKPDASSPGYNAGHGSVIKIGADYYLIYHMGHGKHNIHGISPQVIRDTYVSKLVFVGSEIKQIPAPSIVGGGSHVGNLPGCVD